MLGDQMSEKVVITAGLTGALTRKSHNPAVPYKPEEWAREVRRCEDAGAAVIAVHFRDYETETPTVDSKIMQEVMDAIRSNCKCLVNLSTGVGIGTPHIERKQPVLQHRPEMASLNPGSINFCIVNWRTGEIQLDHTFTNPMNDSIDMGRVMREKRIKPEMECFSPTHIETVLWLQKYHALFEPPLHFGFVFGVAGAMQLNVANLAACVSLIPHDATWSGIGIGPNCFRIGMAALALGGHLRVGLEDNVLLKGDLSKGSWDQVEEAVRMARLVGREPATPDEARKIYSIRPADA
jgi:3-keto-5-aminohexanoate cleavage enzyme